METLVDFITLTKGVEYLIAVLFLLAFPLYWKYLNKRVHKGKDSG